MKKASVVLILIAGLLLCSQTAAAAGGIAVQFKNSSSWAIHNMYLSSVKTDDWGDDQLGDETIEEGKSFTLKDIPSGRYDLKIVDEDGDECVVRDVKIATSEKVELTDEDLLGCQAATENEEEEDEE